MGVAFFRAIVVRARGKKAFCPTLAFRGKTNTCQGPNSPTSGTLRERSLMSYRLVWSVLGGLTIRKALCAPNDVRCHLGFEFLDFDEVVDNVYVFSFLRH